MHIPSRLPRQLPAAKALLSHSRPAPRLLFLSARNFSQVRLKRPAAVSPFLQKNFARYNSSLAVPLSTSPQPADDAAPPQAPAYHLTFTCKPCTHRSTHRVTKQGYHHGTVLIQCPSCRARHVISDHLKIFMDEASTLEDILRKGLGKDGKGNLAGLMKKGKLGMRQGQLVGVEGEEDVEFWEDGTETTGEAKFVESKK